MNAARAHAHANVYHRHPTGTHNPPAVTHSATNRPRLCLCLYPRASRFGRSSLGVCAPGSDARDQAGGRDQATRILRRRVGTRPSGPPARWPAPCGGVCWAGSGIRAEARPAARPRWRSRRWQLQVEGPRPAARVGPVGPDAISPTPAAAGDRGATSGLGSPPQCPRPTPGGTGAHIRVTGATSCAPRARAGARGVVTQRARSARRRRGPASPLVVGSLSRGRVPEAGRASLGPSHRMRPAVAVLASWSRATDLYFLIMFFLALQRLYRVR